MRAILCHGDSPHCGMDRNRARVDDLARDNGPGERPVGPSNVDPDRPLLASQGDPVDVGGHPIYRQPLRETDPLDQCGGGHAPLQTGREEALAVGSTHNIWPLSREERRKSMWKGSAGCPAGPEHLG